MSVIANSTTTNAVFRSDGIQLYGLDAEIELKMQSKRDKNYETEIGKWIEQVSGEKLASDDIADSLKSGIVLCKLLNAIQPATVKHINTRPIALMEVENIQLYLKGCWNIGVPTSDLFVSSDLYNKKGIPQVLQNIVSLARTAQNLPTYKGPPFGAKLSIVTPVKKWETVETNQALYAAEQKAKQSSPTVNICMECGSLKKHLAKICDKCGADMSKQAIVDLAQVLSSLHESKKVLELAHAKYQKAEEANKKLLEQLKQTAQQVDGLRMTTESKGGLDSLKSGSQIMAASPATSPAVSPLLSRNSSPLTSPPTSPVITRSPVTAHIERFPSRSSSPVPVLKSPIQNVDKYPSRSSSPVPAHMKVSSPSSERSPSRCISPEPAEPKSKPTAPALSLDSKSKVSSFTAKIEAKVDSKSGNENDLEQEKAKLQQEKVKFDQERIKFNLEREKFEQEKTKIKQEKETYAKENNRLSLDYQALEKKLRDEVEKAKMAEVKAKSGNDKTKTLNKDADKSQSKLDKEVGKSDEKAKLERDRAKFEQEKQLFEQEKAKLAQDKAKQAKENRGELGKSNSNVEKSNLDQEKAKLGQDKEKLVQEKAKLTQEKARLSKDNDKLSQDYQALERKYREEVGKSKNSDSRVQILEKKLEVAGLASMQNIMARAKEVATKPVSDGRYRPTLEKTFTRRNNINLSEGLYQRLSSSTEDLEEDIETLDIGLDEDMLRYSRDCMVQILFSKPIEFADVYAINDLFKSDTGRRRFTQIMQTTMKEIPTLVLSDNSFELLLYLINTILQQMDLSDSKDLIGAKVLMNSACSLSRVENGTHHFVRDFIKNFELWKNLDFWDEFFWDSLVKKHRKKYGDNIKSMDNDITQQLLTSFAYNMLNWGVSKESTSKFVIEMARKNGLSKEAISFVEDTIMKQNIDFSSKKSTPMHEAQHKFSDKHFSRLTWCSFCKDFIWGVNSKQGFKCEACKCKIHKKCLKEAQSSMKCHAVLQEVNEK